MKKMYKLFSFIAVFCCFIMSACESTPEGSNSNGGSDSGDDDDPTVVYGAEVAFTHTIKPFEETRSVVKEDFADGESVKLFAWSGVGLPVAPSLVDVATYTYNDQKWSSEEKFFYPNSKSNSIFAIYNDADVAVEDFTTVTYSDRDHDLLFAYKVTPSVEEAINLDFYHALAEVKFNFTVNNESGMLSDIQDFKIVFDALSTSATLNLFTKEVELSAAEKVEDDFSDEVATGEVATYSRLIIPQTIGGIKVFVGPEEVECIVANFEPVEIKSGQTASVNVALTIPNDEKIEQNINILGLDQSVISQAVTRVDEDGKEQGFTYTYNNGIWSTDETIYFPNNYKEYSFSGVWSGDSEASLVDNKVVVNADQDVRYAYTTSYDPFSKEEIDLTFMKAYSTLQFDVTINNQYAEIPASELVVTIKDLKTKSTVNIVDNTFVSTDGVDTEVSKDVEAILSVSSWSGDIVKAIVAQTISTDNISFTYAGKDLDVNFGDVTEIALKPNEIQPISITINVKEEAVDTDVTLGEVTVPGFGEGDVDDDVIFPTHKPRID